MSVPGILRKVDVVTVRVPDIDAGVGFSVEVLGHSSVRPHRVTTGERPIEPQRTSRLPAPLGPDHLASALLEQLVTMSIAAGANVSSIRAWRSPMWSERGDAAQVPGSGEHRSAPRVGSVTYRKVSRS